MPGKESRAGAPLPACSGLPGPTECTVSDPSDHWHMQWDFNCDGAMDSDNLWHLRDDHTISDHWLGEISGNSWEVDGVRISIYSPIGDTHKEADLSEDCKEMTAGRYYFEDNTLDEDSSCWWANKG